MHAWVKGCLLFAPCLMAGCASERVILLPNADGHVSHLQVTHGTASAELSKPYEQVAASGTNGLQASATNAAEVQANYGAVLTALPKAPVTYALYFLGDSNELTDESKVVAKQVLAEIAKTPLAEVVIIGHTDSMGTIDYNDDLSLARANVVRDKLMQLGVEGNRIQVAGRGEREMVVKTPDETPEPRNRRVEIDVR